MSYYFEFGPAVQELASIYFLFLALHGGHFVPQSRTVRLNR